MKAIYASKIYQLSTRKDRIASAIGNPINTELVKQLSSYLDSPVESEPSKSDSVVTAPKSKSASNFDMKPSIPKSSTPTKRDFKSNPPFADVDVTDEVVDVETKIPETTSEDDVPLDKFHDPRQVEDDTTSESNVSTVEDEIVEESTVVAATALYPSTIQSSCCDQVRVDAAAIKGTLNLREDTRGVSRIIVRDRELWIHYQDKINLNSVMEPVIEVLNAAGFTNLEFNRLARTENAIVFEISCIPEDTQPIVKEEN